MLVIVESPYASDTQEGIERNEEYARACMRDCFDRGESPFASHLLYTQKEILDDKNKEERLKGMNAGFLWGEKAEASMFYLDLGMSPGMTEGFKNAIKMKRRVFFRSLEKINGEVLLSNSSILLDYLNVIK